MASLTCRVPVELTPESPAQRFRKIEKVATCRGVVTVTGVYRVQVSAAC
jgi:hypothetical protein